MSDILGALTLVSIMLKGKVKPAGEFKGCVPPNNLKEKKLQRVDFNIPVPYGVAYSTFADGCEPDAEVVAGPIVYCLNGKRWDLKSNYKHPAVLAGPQHSDHVHNALFEDDLESVGDEVSEQTRAHSAPKRAVVHLLRTWVRGAQPQNGEHVEDIKACRRNVS